MSHQDQVVSRSCLESAHLSKVMQWLLGDFEFEKELHSSCSWSLRSLAMTALFWAWSRESTMVERFSCAQRLTIHLRQKSINRSTSFQAYMELLRRHTGYLLTNLLAGFRKHMASIDSRWKTNGFVIFGVDGTEVSVPRTRSNQAAFTSDGTSKHQKRSRIKRQNAHQTKQKECPRILMTTLFHISLGLPWSWRLGGKSDNERSQLLSMLSELPKNAMIVGDAGFIGYEFLQAVRGSGAELVVRVGSNVKLLKQLGKVRTSNNLVSIWPKWAMDKRLLPLTFRLIVLNDGRKPVYLITSVLDDKPLSALNIADIYSMRWNIELYHRNLKQTMGHCRLLSRSPLNAKVELNWIVLGYTAMMLYAVDEMIHRGVNTELASAAKIIQAFRQTARDYLHPSTAAKLDDMICNALRDRYTSNYSKESRDYPRKRKRKSPGRPNIVLPNNEQKQLAEELQNQSLTA